MTIEFNEVLKALGIDSAPPLLEQIFNSPDFEKESDCYLRRDFLESISNKYDILGHWQEEALGKAEKICENKMFRIYFNLCVKYLDVIGEDFEAALNLNMPVEKDCKDASDVFPLFVLFHEFSKAEKRYRALGLDEEKLDCIFYKNYMDIVGGKPKKIDRAAFKRYIEEFMPNLVEGETKEQILKYYKEKF